MEGFGFWLFMIVFVIVIFTGGGEPKLKKEVMDKFSKELSLEIEMELEKRDKEIIDLGRRIEALEGQDEATN